MTIPSLDKLQSHLSKIKLLALDVDGTLTDGGLYYTDRGEEMKKFNVKDGQGIKLLMQTGIEVAIVSASSAPSTLYRAKKLGITHVYIGMEDKLTVIQALCDQMGIDLSQVAYVGDDINDVPVMQAIGCPMTVADAMPQNKACALHITHRTGGNGAVREICDLIVLNQSSEARKGN